MLPHAHGQGPAIAWYHTPNLPFLIFEGVPFLLVPDRFGYLDFLSRWGDGGAGHHIVILEGL